MKTKRKDDMPMAARQEVESLGAALHDAVYNGNVEVAAAELIDQQMRQAWEGFNKGEPGARYRYMQLERIRRRLLGFLSYTHLFLDDVETLTGTSLSKGVDCE